MTNRRLEYRIQSLAEPIQSATLISSSLVHVAASSVSPICGDTDEWSPRVEDGRLIVDPRKIKVRDRKERFDDFASWKVFMAETSGSGRVKQHCPQDSDAVTALLASTTPVLIPTFVVTYSDLLTSIRSRCARAKMGGHVRATEVLEQLAYGNYKTLTDPD